VAYCDDTGHARVLVDPAGYKVHPSMVSFHPNGAVVVGAHAKQRRIIDPQNTVYSVKRLIGRSYSSPEVQIAKTRMPYQIKEGGNQSPLIVTRGGEFAVPEISAVVLDHVRDIAASALDSGVNRAVITVPANFNDAQRSATATAGAIAGITVVRVLNEPTAAALAYGHSRPMQEIFAVYDFGGGTFDVTVLRLKDQVYEVLGTAGDSFLGGDDLDERLVDMMVERFLRETRMDLRNNEIAMMRMRAVAEQAKIELSRRTRASIRIDEIAYGSNGAAMNLQMEISRDEFVAAASDIIERTFPVCAEALKIAGTSLTDIGEVILVGGTTKMPYVRDKVARFFGQGPRTDANPEEAVALGASLQAVALQRILSRSKSSTARVSAQMRPPLADAEITVTQDSETMDTSTTLLPPAPRQTADFAARTRPGTERPVTRGATIDKFFEEPSTTEASPLARITRPGTVTPPIAPAAPAPGGPTRSRPISVQIPPLNDDTQTSVGAEPVTQVRTRASTMPPAPSDSVTMPVRPSTIPPVPATMRPPTIPPLPARPSTIPPPMAANEATKTTTRPRGVTLPPLPPAATTLRDMDFPSPLGISAPTSPTMIAAPQEATQFAPPQAPTMIAAPQEATQFAPPQAPVQYGLPSMPPASPPVSPAFARDFDLPPTVSPAFARDFDLPLPAATPPPGSTAVGVAPAAAVHAAAREVVTSPSSPMSATARGIAAAPLAPRTLDPNPSDTNRAMPPPMVMGVPGTTMAPPFAMGAPLAPVFTSQAPVVVDVVPHSFGIATVGGFCDEIIRRNTPLPAESKRLFAKSRDNQDTVRIRICQGQSRRLDQNLILGDLVLSRLRTGNRTESAIEVTFAIDASGMLRVHARDTVSGYEQRVSIDLIGAMSPDDVAASRDRMLAIRRG
jgi:molecular chaperone DnaK